MLDRDLAPVVYAVDHEREVAGIADVHQRKAHAETEDCNMYESGLRHHFRGRAKGQNGFLAEYRLKTGALHMTESPGTTKGAPLQDLKKQEYSPPVQGIKEGTAR